MVKFNQFGEDTRIAVGALLKAEQTAPRKSDGSNLHSVALKGCMETYPDIEFLSPGAKANIAGLAAASVLLKPGSAAEAKLEQALNMTIRTLLTAEAYNVACGEDGARSEAMGLAESVVARG